MIITQHPLEIGKNPLQEEGCLGCPSRIVIGESEAAPGGEGVRMVAA
jgi:hypothetical protein